MVQFKNAVVDVYAPEGQGGADPVARRRVHLQPSNSRTAFEQFGVEVENPYLLMDEPSSASHYVVHGRVVTDAGLVLVVTAEPRLWDVVPAASHVSVLLRELR